MSNNITFEFNMYLLSVIRISIFPSVDSILAGSLTIGNLSVLPWLSVGARTGQGLRL